MAEEVIETVTEDVVEVQPSGPYKNTTTTKNFINPNGPVEVRKKVIKADPKLVVITPKEDRKFRYARKWFDIKRGEQTAVPREVAEDLARCDVIVERIF